MKSSWTWSQETSSSKKSQWNCARLRFARVGIKFGRLMRFANRRGIKSREMQNTTAQPVRRFTTNPKFFQFSIKSGSQINKRVQREPMHNEPMVD